MSKSIIINGDFLKGNKSSTRKQTNTTPRNTTLKPNKIKQALINRIKSYHSELLNKERIENEHNIKKIEPPKSEFDETVDLFNQMTKEKDKRDEKRKLRFGDNITQQSAPTLPSATYLEEAKTRKKRPMLTFETNHNHTVKITANDHVPYGILKGGTKPTYRQFSVSSKPEQIIPIKTELAPNKVEVIPNKIEVTPIKNIIKPATNNDFINERRRRFEEFKKRFNSKIEEKAIQIDNAGITPSNYGNSTKGTRRVHKKIKKHRTLGKYKGKISVLIKNYESRKQVEKECVLLKQTPIGVIKDFLLKRGFIKVGSSAPDFVLRHMYESCFLSGDINNLNGENLLHNYLQNDHDVDV